MSCLTKMTQEASHLGSAGLADDEKCGGGIKAGHSQRLLSSLTFRTRQYFNMTEMSSLLDLIL